MNLEEVKLLREENRLLKEENKILKEKLESLFKRIEELEKVLSIKTKPSFVKECANHRHKKSGQKNGHTGYTRRIPERIDFVKKVRIARCPFCGGKLSKVQEIRERTITDIPEIKAETTKYKKERKYCKKCNKMVEPEIQDALPNARFGLRLMLLITFLKLGLRMPSKKIIELMQIQYGLAISDGEIYKILEQLSRAFGPYYRKLKKKIRKAAVKHIDETGWPINGRMNWLWIFINKETALYVVRRRRSSKVPISILRKQEDKIIESDALPAYIQLCKKAKCKQQLCWAHILRNAKDLKEHYSEASYIHRRLKAIYKQAIKLEHRATEEQIEKLLHQIDLIATRRYKHVEVHKFVKSVCKKHREDLFRFVNNPEIESTNNRAERGLRHAVVIRKISNGSRSKKGAKITSNLLSVIQTLKLQNQNPVTEMKEILLQNSKL